MTDKARETIANIITTKARHAECGGGIVPVRNADELADAILAALPEIIRQNPSIIADMVKPLEWEGWSAKIDDVSYYSINLMARLDGGEEVWGVARSTKTLEGDTEGTISLGEFGFATHILGNEGSKSAAMAAANTHYREQCCAPFFKALGMKECSTCEGTGGVSTTDVDHEGNHLEAPCPECATAGMKEGE